MSSKEGAASYQLLLLGISSAKEYMKWLKTPPVLPAVA